MTDSDKGGKLKQDFPGYHLEPETKFLTDEATVKRILAALEIGRPFTPLLVERDERTNVYSDTNGFRLYGLGAECRSRKASDGDGYRNDVKTSEGGLSGPIGPDDDGIFMRREYNSASKKELPDFSDLDESVFGKELTAKRRVDWAKGYFTRRHGTFSPTGFPDSQIDIAIEHGYYQTPNNRHKSKEIHIIELELKEGRREALLAAVQELKSRYGLTFCAKTKGEMGFEFARQFMDDDHKKKFDHAARKRSERYTPLRQSSRVKLSVDPLFPAV
jgi:inorganic triphosphatase YgiF